MERSRRTTKISRRRMYFSGLPKEDVVLNLDGNRPILQSRDVLSVRQCVTPSPESPRDITSLKRGGVYSLIFELLCEVNFPPSPSLPSRAEASHRENDIHFP